MTDYFPDNAKLRKQFHKVRDNYGDIVLNHAKQQGDMLPHKVTNALLFDIVNLLMLMAEDLKEINIKLDREG